MATMIERWTRARRWAARTFLRPASVTLVSYPVGARRETGRERGG